MKDSNNLVKSLETECYNLKELLNRCQLNQRNLNTTCLVLIEIVNITMRQKNELIEHKKLFDSLCKKWFKLQESLKLSETKTKKKTNECKTVATNKRKENNHHSSNHRIEESNTDLIDYSISSSILSSTSSTSLDSFLNLTDTLKRYLLNF